MHIVKLICIKMRLSCSNTTLLVLKLVHTDDAASCRRGLLITGNGKRPLWEYYQQILVPALPLVVRLNVPSVIRIKHWEGFGEASVHMTLVDGSELYDFQTWEK